MLERNQWLCWAMFSIPLGPEMMPEQSQLQIIPKKDMGHAHRAAGSTGLVVWVQGSPETPGFVSAGANWHVALCHDI